jgi:hypothetical protein
MTPKENNLRTLERLRDSISAELQDNTDQYQAWERERLDLAGSLPGKTAVRDELVAKAKRAGERASDFRHYLEEQPDRGAPFQHDELTRLFNAAGSANDECERMREIVTLCEDRLLEVQEKQQNLRDARTELIARRERTVKEIEDLLKQ